MKRIHRKQITTTTARLLHPMPKISKTTWKNYKDDKITFIRPFVALDNEQALVDRMYREMKKYYDVTTDEIASAVRAAYEEAEKVKTDIREKGEETLRYIDEHDILGIVLAGRPYHIDPEINHGLPELINSYKIAVLTEDSVAHLGSGRSSAYRIWTSGCTTPDYIRQQTMLRPVTIWN